MFGNPQKTYFKKKLNGIQFQIWDFEFKRFKTREVREEVRQVYDGNKSKLQALEASKKQHEEVGSLPKEELARMDDQIVLLKRDIERGEAQIKALDVEIDGSKPTNEYPEGHTGITQMLEGLRELQGMIRDYISGM